MQTSTLALLGGAAVAVAVGAAVYLRPLPQNETAEVAQPDTVEIQEVAVTPDPTVEPEVVVAASDPEPQAEPEVEAQVEAEAEPEAATLLEPAVELEEDVVVAEVDAEVTPDLDAEVTPDVDAEVTPDVDAEVAPEVDAEVAPEVDVVATIPTTTPVLTEFRFEPDGAVLVSGQADSGTSVAILMDGAEIDRLDAGFDGTFFYVGFLGYSDSPRVLSVVADPDGANLLADRTFVMAANPEPVVVAAAEPAVADIPAAEIDEVETKEPEQVDVVPTDPIAPEPINSGVAETASPTILSVTEDGVDVVRAPVGDTSPEVMSTVALDAITYDLDGEVVLQGRALGEGFVQVYVDNAPISRLPVDANGSWRGDLPDVDKGVYTLRIDEVDADGDVVSRIETPFLREDPETVAEALAEEVNDPSFSVATRTVQPGATLWAIAEERYGAGVLFVTVFEANRDRIRDPDLIFPGQVFVLPEDTQ